MKGGKYKLAYKEKRRHKIVTDSVFVVVTKTKGTSESQIY